MTGTLQSLATPIAQALIDQSATVCIAESSTGGLISAALVSIPGASRFYLGGSVVYSHPSRRHLLGIRGADVEGLTPLTEAMALRFAEHARAQLGTTWAVAELGVAGPTASPYGHDAGVCVVGIDGPRPHSIRINTGDNDREENMWHFTQQALRALGEAVAG